LPVEFFLNLYLFVNIPERIDIAEYSHLLILRFKPKEKIGELTMHSGNLARAVVIGDATGYADERNATQGTMPL